MKQEISKDITSIKDQVWKGLSPREVVFGGSGVLMGFTTMIGLHTQLGVQINVAVTLGMPVIYIVGILGFYSLNGMYLDEIIRKHRKAKSNVLTYNSMGTSRECTRERARKGDRHGKDHS